MALAGTAHTTVSSSAEVEAILLALDLAVSPLGIAEFLKTRVDPYMRERAETRFKNEGDDVVGKWSPLRAATIAIRQELGYSGPHPINSREGELEAYITNPGLVTPTGRGANWMAPGRPASNGELQKKFTRAQHGSAKPHTVARPVLGMNEADMRFVLMTLMFYIGERV